MLCSSSFLLDVTPVSEGKIDMLFIFCITFMDMLADTVDMMNTPQPC